jgi:hypothetical protein
MSLELDDGTTWPSLTSRVVSTTVSPLAIVSNGSFRASHL